MKQLRDLLRSIPDYPTPGYSVFAHHPVAGRRAGIWDTIDALATRYQDPDCLGLRPLKARGFIIGSALASGSGRVVVPFASAESSRAVPGMDSELEYGSDR